MNRKRTPLKAPVEALDPKTGRCGTGEDTAPPGHTGHDFISWLHEIEAQQVALGLQNDVLRRANQTLKAAGREMAVLYDCVPLVILSLDRKGVIQRGNEAADLMFGPGLMGREFAALVVPDDRQDYDAWTKRMAGNASTGHCELRVSIKDGRRRHVQLHARPVPRGNGRRLWQYALVDVTTAQKSKKRLKQSRNLYRSLAANLPNGAAFIVDQDLTYVLAEGQALNAAGLTSRDLEGKTLHEALDPEMAAFYEPHYRSVLSGSSMQIEHSSHDRHFVTHLAPLRDEDGAVYAALAVSYDITQRKRAEQALKETQERFHLVVRATKIGPYSRNLQTGEDYWSPEFLSIYGLTPGDRLPLEDDIPAAVHPEDRPQVMAEVKARLAREANPEFSSEHRILLPDGSVRWVMIRGRLDFDPRKRPLRVHGIAMDITERKQAEAALHESNEILNEYAYALTHNIKAPFRAVQNYANFLLEDLAGKLDDEPKQYLEGIKRAVREAGQQFEDLETLYRIRSHDVDFEPLDIPGLLEEIAAMHANGDDQRLVVAENWPRLHGERFLLRQILIGLISNGFKYNRSAVKTVEVGWRVAADRRFEIIVRDNGIGIDRRYHEMIFKIFKRLHTDREYEGTGIGLAIVKRALQKIDGTLRVESVVGEGSTFVVSLPPRMMANV